MPATASVFLYAVNLHFRLQVGHPVHVLGLLEDIPTPLIHGELVRITQHQRDWVVCLIRDIEGGQEFEVLVPASRIHFSIWSWLERLALRPLLSNDLPPYTGPPTLG